VGILLGVLLSSVSNSDGAASISALASGERSLQPRMHQLHQQISPMSSQEGGLSRGSSSVLLANLWGSSAGLSSPLSLPAGPSKGIYGCV
jgi:hypothetical protein